MPSISLFPEAIQALENYEWPGNVRQLKNITEQISIIEKNREISVETLMQYLPDYMEIKLPALFNKQEADNSFSSERELLYKILFDMRNDMNDLKKLVLQFLQKGSNNEIIHGENAPLFEKLFKGVELNKSKPVPTIEVKRTPESVIQDTEEVIEESLSIKNTEKELIKKALKKHLGKRKFAAKDLEIAERTLYRKIKEYKLQ